MVVTLPLLILQKKLLKQVCNKPKDLLDVVPPDTVDGGDVATTNTTEETAETSL